MDDLCVIPSVVQGLDGEHTIFFALNSDTIDQYLVPRGTLQCHLNSVHLKRRLQYAHGLDHYPVLAQG